MDNRAVRRGRHSGACNPASAEAARDQAIWIPVIKSRSPQGLGAHR
jgi:hypothetical protein